MSRSITCRTYLKSFVTLCNPFVKMEHNPRIFLNENNPVETDSPTEIDGIIRLDDLTDPNVRYSLYMYIDRLLCRMNPLHNTNEMYALRNTQYALESDRIVANILNINSMNQPMVEEEEQNNIPDAQPLDPDFIPFENNDIMETEMDESESDMIYQYAVGITNTNPFERNENYYELPTQPIVEETNSQNNRYFATRNIGSYHNDIIPKRFTMERSPITENMLKNPNKNMCVICLETPTNLQLAITHCCANTFCVSCLKNWEKNCCDKFMDATCPLCRKNSPDVKIFCETYMNLEL